MIAIACLALILAAEIFALIFDCGVGDVLVFQTVLVVVFGFINIWRKEICEKKSKH